MIGLKVRDARNQEIQVLIKITIVIKNTTAPKFIFYQRSLLQVRFEVSRVSSGNNATSALPSGDNKNAQGSVNTQGGAVNLPTNNQPNPVNPQTPTQPQTPTKTNQTNPTPTPTPTKP